MEIFKRGSKRVSGAAGLVFALAAVFAAAAMALTPAQTRESYVEQVEPICKKNTKANERILKGAEKKVREGKLKVAAGQFTQAAGAFEKAVKELRAVQQPPEDTAKLTKWLKQLDVETELLRKIGKALREEKKTQAQTFSVKLRNNSNIANNIVLGFDFNYCLIDPSKFS